MEKSVVFKDLPKKSVDEKANNNTTNVENKVRQPKREKATHLVLSEAFCTISFMACQTYKSTSKRIKRNINNPKEERI